ncbi:MAG TPA: RNA polymerase sigma factor [Solirubrobacteraceae bacterium]|nr:RNA polymerase sigma factor [Solirubrobacteraceae bacterium]
MRRLDPKALGQHLDPLYRAAWGMCGSREDAEDLVQETFARVLARPRMIRGDERGYLMRALRNTFYSRLRSASRRPQTGAAIDDVQPADPRATQQPEGAAEVSEILEAIAALPEDFRMTIVAIDILGLSYAEAARALDTREATITTRLYRARQRVVRAMSDDPPPDSGQPREGSEQGKVQEGSERGSVREGSDSNGVLQRRTI